MHTRARSLIAALVIAVGIVGGAGVASAAPDDNAVCVAENISLAHSIFGGQGFAEVIVVPDARAGGAGDTIRPNATTDCGG